MAILFGPMRPRTIEWHCRRRGVNSSYFGVIDGRLTCSCFVRILSGLPTEANPRTDWRAAAGRSLTSWDQREDCGSSRRTGDPAHACFLGPPLGMGSIDHFSRSGRHPPMRKVAPADFEGEAT